MTETAAQKHAYISYAGSVLADHGIDSANAQLWSVTEQAAENIFAQVAYTTQTPASYMTITEYKVVLDQALFLDSTADGFHFISVATNSAIPANRKSSVSVTFKSGTTYNAGDPIDMYNNFFIVAHETIDNGFVTYSTGDENMSSLVDKDTQLINATLGIYSPTIAYTPGLAELVDISFKVTCPTCNLVGASTSVNNVNAAEVADAYPNPANNMLTIPFTMNQTSNVSVVVTNAVGATLASQNLGKINAKQTGSAKINVASFANGVYFYTVDANGQRTTKRFVVAH
jgi:hypothetical protein